MRALIAVFSIAVLIPGAARGDIFKLGGYGKSFFVDTEYPAIAHAFGADENPPPSGSVSNRLRLNAELRPSDRLAIHVSYDFAPQVRDRSMINLGLFALDRFNVTGGYRIDDLHPQLYPSLNDSVGDFSIEQNLDRAFATINAGPADITVGRQAIAFGSARVINPTDVFAPFAYQTLDTEDRAGVDAVRVRKPLGFMGELDVGYLPGHEFHIKEGAYYVRGKYYIARTDATAIVAVFRQNLMLGIDLARAVGGASAWLEAANVWVDEMADPKTVNQEKYFRLSAGADYSFSDKLYGLVEYHYNGPGKNDPEKYYAVLSSKAVSEGNVFLLGRHYLIPGATYQFTPLITGTAEVLANLSDGSVYMSPSIEYNIAQNVYLAGGAFIGLGGGLELNATPASPFVIHSEFGIYPDIFYTSFRVYF